MSRAKEREKFDEMIRVKDEEKRRINEERSKAQEKEEALRLKELRMKAIPKAHEVPDWYAHAPKRSRGDHS
jgi:hypothetical protein